MFLHNQSWLSLHCTAVLICSVKFVLGNQLTSCEGRKAASWQFFLKSGGAYSEPKYRAMNWCTERLRFFSSQLLIVWHWYACVGSSCCCSLWYQRPIACIKQNRLKSYCTLTQTTTEKRARLFFFLSVLVSLLLE